MAGQGKLRRDIKRMFKNMQGYEFIRLEYKSHGGHGELFYYDNGVEKSFYMGLNRSPKSTTKLLKPMILKGHKGKIVK